MAVPARNASAERIVASARTFHVTSSTFGKRFLLQSDCATDLFIRVLYECRAKGLFRLHEFVVMPNHFHVLITVGANTSIEQAVQLIKGRFSFRAGKELGLRSPVWQRGFSEARVFNAIAAERARLYIWDNPVRAGLVLQPSEYRFSSACAGYALDPLPEFLRRVRA